MYITKGRDQNTGKETWGIQDDPLTDPKENR